MPTIYQRPKKLEIALDILSQDNWKILSGGTDFFPALGDKPASGNILDISAIEQLRDIKFEGKYWRIGTLATWSDLITAELPQAFDALKMAGKEVGSVQIQNRATIAGNICNASPAADGLPPLLILDALIEISSAGGSRQIPLSKFVTGNRQTELKPGEMVSAILIPASSGNGVSSFQKLGSRKYLVISIAMVAARLVCDDNGTTKDVAVSVGACSLVAQRLTTLEQDLIGRNIDTDFDAFISMTHLTDLSPIDDVRSPATYRMEAALELVKRVIYQTLEKCR